MPANNPRPTFGVRGAREVNSNNNAGAENNGQVPPEGVQQETRSTAAPRQSACVQAQLKVLRMNLERLMGERTLLKGVKGSLRQLLDEMDNEILVVKKMRDLSTEATLFMTQKCAEDTARGKPRKSDGDEPQPHCSKTLFPN